MLTRELARPRPADWSRQERGEQDSERDGHEDTYTQVPGRRRKYTRRPSPTVEIFTSPMEAHVLTAPVDRPGTFTIGQHRLEMWHRLAPTPASGVRRSGEVKCACARRRSCECSNLQSGRGGTTTHSASARRSPTTRSLRSRQYCSSQPLSRAWCSAPRPSAGKLSDSSITSLDARVRAPYKVFSKEPANDGLAFSPPYLAASPSSSRPLEHSSNFRGR